MRISVLISLLCLLVLSTSCFTKWSEEEREVFRAKCAAITTFSDQAFLFRGFYNVEIDTITVKEYNQGILLDSFQIHVSPSVEPYGVKNGLCNKEMNVNYTYHFIVPGYRPYILEDMAMGMVPQYTMMSENYGCVLNSYTIDGKHFKNDKSPVFVKR